jgi:hypothetical protein
MSRSTLVPRRTAVRPARALARAHTIHGLSAGLLALSVLTLLASCSRSPMAPAPSESPAPLREVAGASTLTGESRFVDAEVGDDDGPGTAEAPWRTIARANRAPSGTTVWVSAGTYADAPTAPGVTFRGAHLYSLGSRVITPGVTLAGRGTRIVGFTLAGGLAFVGGASDNLVDHCFVEGRWSITGTATAAPRMNWITSTRMNLDAMSAHTYGDDRDRTVPRIVSPVLENCIVTVRRSGGVLWRWSGVDDARITGTTIRLVNGGAHNDDDASWKWLYVRNSRIEDSRIVLDHEGDFGGTGPFAPMWRDSTVGTQMVRTTVEAVRGSMIFSPNTHGTWSCSCGDNRFEDVTLRAPGTVWLYQCERPESDVWAGSRVIAGRFEKYNTGVVPPGLAVLPIL